LAQEVDGDYSMTKEIEELVRKYVADVNAQWKTGEATEHSYRPALKALLRR